MLARLTALPVLTFACGLLAAAEPSSPSREEVVAAMRPYDGEAADNALELAKVLAGRGGISDQGFLERTARSDKLWPSLTKECFLRKSHTAPKAGRARRTSFDTITPLARRESGHCVRA